LESAGKQLENVFKNLFRFLGIGPVAEAVKANPDTREKVTELAREQQASLKADLRRVGQENNQGEFKANDGLGTLHARIPLGVFHQMKQEHGWNCWDDPAFMEDFLKHHPECLVRTTRGTRGQEYGGNGRR
jgi:hypothetical protein